MTCGAPIQATDAIKEERKVVTALFCDLVGLSGAPEATGLPTR